MSKKLLLLGSVSVLMATSACSTFSPKLEDARYWQRKTASSALYMRGAKAQQMLHLDIASCSNEIKELQNLGAIRKAMPTNYNSGNSLEDRTAAQRELDEWDTPERDGYLYAEHLDYHDFETCMYAKGWERVDYLSHTDIDKAREDYLKNTGRYKEKSSYSDRENVTSVHPSPYSSAPNKYENLNE
ncbi:MAG: hypothetical protein CMH31_04020 [Micavibrio sp.]|mgnify:CR=1 FL=1|nr:hypothetical protein [Micavibrio sp.]